MLPKLTINLRERDPQWVAIFPEDGGPAINADEYYKRYDIEVEIVQLNLNTGTMRVRYMWPDKNVKKGESMQSRDIHIDAFYNEFSIVKKA